ncbi:MAG: DHHA1 domain-containing protein [Deltaproteobacteria bacterium]|nr:DHHA1 domain-containing protein [Deltaproteobacteria bacterium]
MSDARPLIIFHADCTDGFTAAWIAARALGDVELFPAFYGVPPPDVTDRTVWMLDFAYPRSVMEQLGRAAAELGVIDHHQTAAAALAGLEAQMLAEGRRVGVIFEQERSGAGLAWDYFVEGGDYAVPAVLQNAEWLALYVEDRDLWRWKLHRSRLVSAGIEAVPKTLEAWDALAARSPGELAVDGLIIERYRRICIAAAVTLARPARIGGAEILLANSSEMRFASDTAHELAAGRPFGATWWLRADGKVQFSLRSREDGVDVSEVAKQYGGGGHRHAAGFQVPFEQLGSFVAEAPAAEAR